MEKLQTEYDAFEKEDDINLETLKGVLQFLRSHSRKYRNLQLDIKEGLERAECALEEVKRSRRSWKNARKALLAAQKATLMAARRAPALRERRTQGTSRVPKVPGIRRRDVTNTPSPSATGTATHVKTTGHARKSCGVSQRIITLVMENTARVDGKVTEDTKARWKRPKRVRPEVVLIRPVGNIKYEDILKKIRKELKPEDLRVTIKGISATLAGEALVELGATSEDKNALSDKLSEVIGATGSVHQLVPRTQLEISDIDAMAGEDEVREAILHLLGDSKGGEFKVTMTKANRWGRRVAFLDIDETTATKLVAADRIKIGWISCRIKRRDRLKRCFRYHGYGHLAIECKAEDRRALCWRCGVEGHQSSKC